MIYQYVAFVALFFIIHHTCWEYCTYWRPWIGYLGCFSHLCSEWTSA